MGKEPGELSRVEGSTSPPSLASAEKPPDAEVRCGQEAFMEDMRSKYANTLDPKELDIKLNQIWSTLNEQQRRHYFNLKSGSKENISCHNGKESRKNGREVSRAATSYDKETANSRRKELFDESRKCVETVGRALGIPTTATPNVLPPPLRSSQNAYTETMKTTLRQSQITSSVMSRKCRYPVEPPTVPTEEVAPPEEPIVVRSTPMRTIAKPVICQTNKTSLSSKKSNPEFPKYVPAPHWKSKCVSALASPSYALKPIETPTSVNITPLSRSIRKLETSRRKGVGGSRRSKMARVAGDAQDSTANLSYEQAVYYFYQGLMQPLVRKSDEPSIVLYDMQKVGDIVENRVLGREYIGLL